jgi:hypothetical protein
MEAHKQEIRAMDKEPTLEKKANKGGEHVDTDAEAADKAKTAGEAKAEELRNVLQSKVEQGKSSLGFLPPEEEES